MITHIASGRSLWKAVDLRQARKALNAVATLANWKLPASRYAKRKQLSERVSAIFKDLEFN